jgi:threonine dehydrogenase-like Zn-dependent dehydrogenase
MATMKALVKRGWRMATMKALVKRGAVVGVAKVPRPRPRAADDVLVRVAVAGICRTDLYVAEGRLPGPDPIILGHEFAGHVEQVDAACGDLRRGDRVAVMPVIPCRDCPSCAEGRDLLCLRRTMLGVDRDGAFAEFVVVPARCVYRIPGSVSMTVGAYAEPVAAALAVLNAGIRADQVGLIYGNNRFARLVERILRAHGFERVAICDPEAPGERPEPHAYDFIIETYATAEALAEIVRAARPRGTIVLKSRQPWPAGIDLLAAIPKELTFRAVNYGPFAAALGLLAERRIELDDLLGPTFPLDDFARAFAQSCREGSSKIFLAPPADDVRDR